MNTHSEMARVVLLLYLIDNVSFATGTFLPDVTHSKAANGTNTTAHRPQTPFSTLTWLAEAIRRPPGGHAMRSLESRAPRSGQHGVPGSTRAWLTPLLLKGSAKAGRRCAADNNPGPCAQYLRVDGNSSLGGTCCVRFIPCSKELMAAVSPHNAHMSARSKQCC